MSANGKLEESLDRWRARAGARPPKTLAEPHEALAIHAHGEDGLILEGADDLDEGPDGVDWLQPKARVTTHACPPCIRVRLQATIPGFWNPHSDAHHTRAEDYPCRGLT